MKYLFLTFISGLVLANTSEAPEVNSFDYTRDMYKKVKTIVDLEPEKFEDEINSIREDIDNYIQHKKNVCQGDFSTVILDKESSKKNEYKLSTKEQELCYRELKALQVTYINNLFTARKKYLDLLHSKRIEKLSRVREDALKELQITFDKKILRKKSRKKYRRRKKK